MDGNPTATETATLGAYVRRWPSISHTCHPDDRPPITRVVGGTWRFAPLSDDHSTCGLELLRGHEKGKVPAFGHEKSQPLTEASTKEAPWAMTVAVLTKPPHRRRDISMKSVREHCRLSRGRHLSSQLAELTG